MVISASYKTDIPAFYGRWFLNRLDAGYCWVKNPVSGRPFFVSLERRDVDGIVFWTKNPWPFMDSAKDVRRRGYPFYFQYTITGYRDTIERAVLPPERSFEAVRRINAEHSKGSVVWRYDPIIVCDAMPLEWHVSNFEYLAAHLSGQVDEVATKFLVLHAKTRRNLAHSIGQTLYDPSPEVKAEHLQRMHESAKRYGMKLTLCSQPGIPADLRRAVCIDARRLNSLGASIEAPKTLGNRPGCLCIEARDIGDYDTCPQGCVYCYATQHQQFAIRRHRLHDPAAASLFPMKYPPMPLKVRPSSLFGGD